MCLPACTEHGRLQFCPTFIFDNCLIFGQRLSWETNGLPTGQTFPAFCGIRRFIRVFTRARHLSLSWKLRSYRVRGLSEWLETWYVFLWRADVRTSPKPQGKGHIPYRLSTTPYLICSLHICGRSSIPNLRTRYAVVTGHHLSRSFQCDRLYKWNIIGQMYTLMLHRKMCRTF